MADEPPLPSAQSLRSVMHSTLLSKLVRAAPRSDLDGMIHIEAYVTISLLVLFGLFRLATSLDCRRSSTARVFVVMCVSETSPQLI
jgi:hypothetical protein